MTSRSGLAMKPSRSAMAADSELGADPAAIVVTPVSVILTRELRVSALTSSVM
jgi:hypothetical protein